MLTLQIMLRSIGNLCPSRGRAAWPLVPMDKPALQHLDVSIFCLTAALGTIEFLVSIEHISNPTRDNYSCQPKAHSLV